MCLRYVLVVPPPSPVTAVAAEAWRTLWSSIEPHLRGDQVYLSDFNAAKWIGAGADDAFNRARTGPESSPEALVSTIHSLLDQLPHHRALYLDLICLVDQGESVPIDVTFAVHRATMWFQARAVIWRHAESQPDDSTEEDLDALVLFKEDLPRLKGLYDARLFWRGYLELFDRQQMAYEPVEPLCQLVAKDESILALNVPAADTSVGGRRRSHTRRQLPLSDLRLTTGLRPLASVKRAQLAPMVVGVEFSLMTHSGAVADVLSDQRLFGREDTALVCRLNYCAPEDARPPGATSNSAAASLLPTSDSLPPRTLEEWQRAVVEGKVDRSPDDNIIDVKQNSLFFAVFHAKESSSNDKECMALLLDPTRLPLPENAPQATTHAFQPLSIRATKESVMKARAQMLGDAFNASVIEDNEEDEDCENESSWPERRLLEALDHYQRMADNKPLGSNALTPSGEFVVLEAGELLRLFSEGMNSKNLEPLKPRRQPYYTPIEEVKASEWPDVLLVEHPSLMYNRGSDGEAVDYELQRLQRLYVGAREMASTCGSKVAGAVTKPDVVCKDKKPSSAQADVEKAKTASLEDRPMRSKRRKEQTADRGSRKPLVSVQRLQPPLAKQDSVSSASVKSGRGDRADLFKRKVRLAVYNALVSEGMIESHKLFKSCFRRLFDLCCTFYAKDSGVATSALLEQLAQSNVKLTIASEKALASLKK